MDEIAVGILTLFIFAAAALLVAALLYGIVTMARGIRNLDREGEAEDRAVRANRQSIKRNLGKEIINV
jgi:hypothetical protein